eukprot:scaffold11720_cov48-Phaeocystis_antarctica.AAC.2
MATATPRHEPASEVNWAFNAGAECIAPARSKSAAASMSSAADRGATSQPPHAPLSTVARMVNALASFGAALTTLADSALSPSSLHHSGLATSAHAFSRSMSKAFAVATAESSEPTGWRSLASRYRCAASTSCPEYESIWPRLRYAIGSSGLRAMASR